jgi:hypothetical protein
MGVGVGGAGVALAAFAVAGFEAAKSPGQYGIVLSPSRVE